MNDTPDHIKNRKPLYEPPEDKEKNKEHREKLIGDIAVDLDDMHGSGLELTLRTTAQLARIREVHTGQLEQFAREIKKIKEEWSKLSETERETKKEEVKQNIDVLLNSITPSTESKENQPPVAETEATAETEPEENEPTEESTLSISERAAEKLRGSLERMKRYFTGEVQPEEEEGYEYNAGDFARAATVGAVSIAMTYTGTKFPVEAVRYLIQGRTTEKERQEILAALKNADSEFGPESFVPSPVTEKQRVLAERIAKSTHLTEAKKQELISRMNEIVARHDDSLETAVDQRNEEVLSALEDAIQRRVKGTQVLKEGLNTALVASGVAGLRTLGYTAVAVYERHQKVQQERESGEREGGYLQEMIVGTATETYNKLVHGGGKESRMARNMTRLQAATVLMRGAALAGLAGGEISGAGGPSKILEAAAAKWEASGGNVGNYILDNISSHMDKTAEQFTSLFGLLKNEGGTEAAAAGAGVAKEVLVETVEQTPAAAMHMELSEAEPVTGTVVSAEEGLDYTPVSVETGEPIVPESPGAPESPEIPAERLADAMVSSKIGENSIVGLLTKQLEANPDGFGYEGDPSGVKAWAQGQALEAARASGAIQSGSDTRLATESIGRLAVMAVAKEGGGVEMQLFDTEAGSPVSLEDAAKLNLTYEGASAGGAGTTGVGSAEKPVTPEPRGNVAGIDDLTVEGGRIDFTHSGDGESVLAAEIKDLNLTPDQEAAIAGMLDGPELTAAVAEAVEGDLTSVEDASRAMAGYIRVFDKLDKMGLAGSPEAGEVLLGIYGHLEQIPPDLIAEDAIPPHIIGALKSYDVSVLESPAGDGMERVGDLRVAGLGKIEFQYAPDGRPILNPEQLLQDAKGVVDRDAAKLLQEGWREQGTELYTDARMVGMKETATKVYIYETALKQLEAQGNGESGEADILRQYLDATLRSPSGQYLDQSDPIVRGALARGSFVLTETAPPPTGSDLESKHDAGIEEGANKSALIAAYESAPEGAKDEALANIGRYYVMEKITEAGAAITTMDGTISTVGGDIRFELTLTNQTNEALSYVIRSSDGTETNFVVSLDSIASPPVETAAAPPVAVGAPPAAPEGAPRVPGADSDLEAKVRYTKDGEIKSFKGDGIKARFQINKEGETWNVLLPQFNWMERVNDLSDQTYRELALEKWDLTPEQINQGFLSKGFDHNANELTDGMMLNMAKLEGYAELQRQMEVADLTGTDAYREVVEKVENQTRIIQEDLQKIRITADRKTA